MRRVSRRLTNTQLQIKDKIYAEMGLVHSNLNISSKAKENSIIDTKIQEIVSRTDESSMILKYMISSRWDNIVRTNIRAGMPELFTNTPTELPRYSVLEDDVTDMIKAVAVSVKDPGELEKVVKIKLAEKYKPLLSGAHV